MSSCYNKLCLRCNSDLYELTKKNKAVKGDLCVVTKPYCGEHWRDHTDKTEIPCKTVGMIMDMYESKINDAFGHTYDVLINGVLREGYYFNVVIKLEVAEAHNLLS